MESNKSTITNDLLASKGQRLLNFIIDAIIVYIIIAAIGVTVNLVGEVTKTPTLMDWVSSMNNNLMYLLIILITILYFALTEIYFSRTFAKYFTKTIVVNSHGGKPSVNAIIKRTLCRFIPFEPFTFLGLNSRGWHDSFSKTYVVKKHLLLERQSKD
jgi:uncharacterized RDD family membrane protein YckC